MKKNVFLIAIAAVTLTTMVACSEDFEWNENKIPDYIVGTNWQLTGYVNNKGKLTEALPRKLGDRDCYTFTFLNDSVAAGYTIGNEFSFIFVPKIHREFCTQFGDTHIGNVKLFYDAFSSLSSLQFVNDGEIRIYYNNKKNYLLYSKLNTP